MSETLYHECRQLIAQSRACLEDLQSWGIGVSAVSFPGVADAARPAATANDLTLKQLEQECGGCQRCALARERQKVVFGAGSAVADLVLVGEAPGREEDQQGYPFVGEAGRLLDRILFAMGLQRDDVYICNLIKCRPPQNRDPEAEEIAACVPYLKQQLALIRPRVIVALGRFAAHTLLHSQAPISRLRGQWYEYEGIPLMPTYHPAYLLRNPAGKREVWDDMKAVMARLRN